MKSLTIDPGIQSMGVAYYDSVNDELHCDLTLMPARYDRKKNSNQKVRGDLRRTRRQISRTSKRSKRIKRYFGDLNVQVTQKDLSASNPYQLRADGLCKKLSAQEQLIVAINIAKNRGFVHSHTDDKEIVDSYEKVCRFENELKRYSLTPGEYLLQHQSRKTDVNAFLRQSIKNEYRKIAIKQAELGEDLLSGIEDVVFFQHKPYFHESSIGRCIYDLDEMVTQKSRREYHRYVITQMLNNIRYVEDNKTYTLNQETKDELIARTMSGSNVTWKQLRKLLNQPRAIFNYEATEKCIPGSPSDKKFIKVNALWKDLSEEHKNCIVELVLESQLRYLTQSQISDEIQDRFSIEASVADSFSKVILPSDRGRISLKSIRRILEGEFLEPQKVTGMSGVAYARSVCSNDIQVSNVQHAINYLHKYHDVSRVNIEVVADQFVDKDALMKEQKENRILRAKASKWLDDSPFENNSSNLKKRVAFVRQGGKTFYSNQVIDEYKLYNTNFYNFDHIIPQSRYCDNSQGNLVLEERTLNEDKGNKLPSEWLSPTELHDVIARAQKMKIPGIVDRLSLTQVPDSFCQRDLTMTSYTAQLIARSLQVECDFQGWNIEVITVTSDAAWSVRRKLDWHKDRTNNLHHMVDAAIIGIVTSADNLYDGIEKVRDRVAIIESAANPSKVKIVKQRADRGAFTETKIIKANKYKPNVCEKVGDGYRKVSAQIKVHIYQTNTGYKCIYTNLWKRMNSGSPTKNGLVGTLSVNEVVKVVDGDKVYYYFLKEVDGMRFHPIEKSKIVDGDKDRSNYLNNWKNLYTISRPSREEIKNNVRLVFTHK